MPAVLSRRHVPTVVAACSLVALVHAGPAATNQFVRVSTRNARYFETADGQPFIPIGLNIAHPLHGGPGRERQNMECWLRALAAQRGNLIRIWLWHSWWCPETAPGVFEDRGADRLRELLDLCGRCGVRVKLTLDHFREIDPATVRQPWALRATYHVSQGGPLRTMDEWWNSEAGRRLFLARLDWLAARFHDRPEVFGWELWNEINATLGRPEHHARWTLEMLAEARRRFPHHLVMQSLGGYEYSHQHALYQTYPVMAGNDVAQVHRYLNLGGSLPVVHGPMDVLAADAVIAVRAVSTNRPVLLAESGAVEPHHRGPFALYERDREGTLLHDVLFAPFFTGAAGTGQPWHWDHYIARHNLWWHFGRFASAIEGFDPLIEAPRVVLFTSAPPLRVYGLVGCSTTLVWCRDGRADWRAELERGESPPSLEGLAVPFEPFDGPPADGKVEIYDPWTDRRVTHAAPGPVLRLPKAYRSLVLRWRRNDRPRAP